MTEPQIGSIQLDRTVDSILVGARQRADLGDIDALAASIGRDGLLQPLTITIDGVLVCGARRLAAIKKLGWRTVNVWVRSGLSDRLGQLLAEQDDNMLHKPYNQLEAAGLPVAVSLIGQNARVILILHGRQNGERPIILTILRKRPALTEQFLIRQKAAAPAIICNRRGDDYACLLCCIATYCLHCKIRRQTAARS